MAFRKGSSTWRQKQQADDEGSSTSDSDSSNDQVSVSISDIDDAEIFRYLLTKEQSAYKTIIWEAMNKDYVERRSTRKRGIKDKEAGRRRKAAKTCGKSADNSKKSNEGGSNLPPGVKTGRSSKINYSALNEEDCGFKEDLESNQKVIREVQTEEVEDGQGYDDNNEYAPGNQYDEEDESYYANDDDIGDNDGWF